MIRSIFTVHHERNQNGSLKSTEATLTVHSRVWEKKNRVTTTTVKATQANQFFPNTHHS
jgi:hypothetical protein